MSTTDLLTRIERTLAPSVADHGLFLEGVALSGPPNRRVLRVTVDLEDGPGGVASDALEAVTRAISAVLDDDDPLAGAYMLEVTTPGVDRPLTTPRHFRRNIGRLVTITTAGEEPETFTGRMVSVTEAQVRLDADSGPRDVEHGQIAKAVVELEFRPRGKGAK